LTTLVNSVPSAARGALRGYQTPRIFSAPPFSASTGAEAIDLAKMAGLILDEWQQTHLTAAMGETDEGRWAALEVALVVARQQGKNSELEVRQITGLFLLEEDLQIHSAHMADTSVEQFLRIEALIDGTPEFSRRVKKMDRGKGSEAIQLHRHPKTGRAPRLRFRTRTGGGARGFSAETVYLDEAYDCPEAFHGTLMPVVSAKSITGNPQIWYTSSAVDQEINPDGIVLSRLRERALKGDDPSLVYAEHSANAETPDDVTREMALDPERWAEANPALGIRISPEHILVEQRSMSARSFAVERLGVGDWPRTDGLEGVVIQPEAWAKCTDRKSKQIGKVCFAVDVQPDRSHSAIGVAGLRSDGLFHVEVVKHKSNTGWVVEEVARLVKDHDCTPVMLDGRGAAGNLIEPLEDAGVKVEAINATEVARACGSLFDAVTQRTLRHIGQAELADAVRGATKRSLGDAWAWNRKNLSVDISPLVCITLALHGIQTIDQPGTAEVVDLNQVLQEMLDNGEDPYGDPYA